MDHVIGLASIHYSVLVVAPMKYAYACLWYSRPEDFINQTQVC